ncbi:type IX secretion system membrane protein PorP/SprF [Maribacter sp. 1_MG-2023]|uniref:PorP/SprF family type IX secretion system membrane protein n=1 Tax=Maribacter sp. 1_MG-2023 TaxID=3062677 RepID=UPI0026E25C77|nr:type IX secretion system membrane protein PorP/SprF [Maribacter sp. 1_MG-2023]MDO6471370.1 type IX secretion system membrane protein PorP/SprF [Maribacter sp. 1_MG-2023]
MDYNFYKSSYTIALVLFSLLGFNAFSQKEPQYTQYMYNIGSFNPAYVGTVENPEFSGLYRAQWIDIPGAPRTFRFGANLPFKNEKVGLGINIVNDELGPATQTYADISYSYQIKVTDETKLSFGIDAGGSFLNVDFSKGIFENPGENLSEEMLSKFYPTVGAGAFLYSEDWYLGASVPNFLTEGVYNDEIASVVEDKLQFNFIGGYVFELSDNLKFKPAFLVNTISGSPVNVNLSSNFLISDVVTAGVSYRLDNAFSGLAGFQISNTLFAGYSYDYNTNLLGEFNKGSHEIILKFYLGRKGPSKSKGSSDNNAKGKPKQVDSPRFF